MKKNKFMRLASGLLVGTLLTTCAISGTFAKYTTQDAAEDSARVAKWGVELQIMGSLYGDAYVAGAKDDSVPTLYSTDDSVSVYNKNEDKNVVAPGTKSDAGLTFKLNGTPEVDSKLLVEMEIENIFLKAGTYGVMIAATNVTEQNFKNLGDLYTEAGGVYTIADDWAENTDYYTLEDAVTYDKIYYPVVYNLTGSDLKTTNTNDNATDKDTLKAIADSIEFKLTGANAKGVQVSGDFSKYTYSFESVVYPTNADLGDETQLSDVNLSWDWHFTDEDGVDGDEISNDPQDGLDTILGNLQADIEVVKLDTNGVDFTNALVEGDDYNLETSFMLDITVNQVD